jgi:tRNA nucleotidyltransferase/poly(A) polymerase
MSIIHELPSEFTAWLESVDPSIRLWLVGGAVRDSFLGRTTVDFDFVTTGDALTLARMTADELGGDVYALDRERGTARVLLEKDSPARRIFDFAAMREATIEADLEGRDFTINAIAVDLRRPDVLLDPCGGLADIRAGVVRVCARESIGHDPVRGLRALRLASEFGFQIDGRTRQLIHQNASAVKLVSHERIRDELFRMLAVDEPATPYYLIRHFGFEEAVFGAALSEGDAERVLALWRELAGILNALAPEYDPESAASASVGLLIWQLGRFRSGLWKHFQEEITLFRRRRELCFLSSLFWLMPTAGDDVARTFGDLRLSQAEIHWVSDFIDGMDSIHELKPTPVSIYRFFRMCSSAGVCCGLVHLAHILASEGSQVQASEWAEQVGNVRAVLEAYFERRRSLIDPEPLATGDDLIRELNIAPGPLIGQILEVLREMQVAGQIVNREQAIEAAQQLSARLGDDHP